MDFIRSHFLQNPCFSFTTNNPLMQKINKCTDYLILSDRDGSLWSGWNEMQVGVSNATAGLWVSVVLLASMHTVLLKEKKTSNTSSSDTPVKTNLS